MQYLSLRRIVHCSSGAAVRSADTVSCLGRPASTDTCTGWHSSSRCAGLASAWLRQWSAQLVCVIRAWGSTSSLSAG